MFDNYLNILLSNSMPGAVPHTTCTCGHESDKFVYTAWAKCPNCNTLISDYKNDLFFNKISFNYNAGYFIDLSDKLYNFALILIKRKGSYKINFTKKKLYKLDLEYNDVNVIIFDAHVRDPKDAVKFYNVNTKTYYKDDKDFKSKVDISQYHCKDHNLDVKGVKLKSLMAGKGINSIYKILKDLAKWCFVPHNEILIKAGLEPEVISDWQMNINGTNPSEILKLNKYTIKQYMKYGQNRSNYLAFKYLEEELGDKIVPYVNKFVEEDSIWLNSYTSEKMIKLIKEANLSIEKLYRYLYKDIRLQQCFYSVRTAVDYLADCFDMTRQLNLVFDKAPKALKRYHDTLVKEISTIEKKEFDSKINSVASKYQKLIKLSDYNENNEPIDKYSIILPVNAKEIITEGRNMKHCVGSYVSKMAFENSIILFLRPSKSLDTSYVTMEYNPNANSIVQIKGVGNSRVNNECMEFIKKWAKEKDIKISSYY